MDLELVRLASASTIGLALVGAAGACDRGPSSIAPILPAASTCPLEGCGGAGVARLGAARAPDACVAAGPSPCAGVEPHECAERALAAWSVAQGDREVTCVARTLIEACALGDAKSCGYAGRLVLDGRGATQDAEGGVSMLTKACEGDVAIACLAALRWLADERNAASVNDAVALRARLDGEYNCLTGSPIECFQAGSAFFVGRDPFPKDYIRSAAEYRRGCDLGQGLACSNLGDAYEYGNGVPRDLTRAAGLYSRACGAGVPLGCANLGHLIENGEGVARSAARARELYQGACARGDTYGCLHAEMMAAASRGPQKALEQWQRACERHDARACAYVGVVFEDGPDGLARDEPKSLEAMGQACKLGYAGGCDWVSSHQEP